MGWLMLSGKQMERFCQLAPKADLQPMWMSLELWQSDKSGFSPQYQEGI